jgi:hypothetical protein
MQRTTRLTLLLALPVGLGLEILMIALAFGWVAVYAYLINPGLPDAEYEAYAQVSSPVVSIVAGLVCFFFVGRLFRRLGKPAAGRVALATLAIYILIDAAIIVAAMQDQQRLDYWLIALASYATKSAAMMVGTRNAGIRP